LILRELAGGVDPAGGKVEDLQGADGAVGTEGCKGACLGSCDLDCAVLGYAARGVPLRAQVQIASRHERGGGDVADNGGEGGGMSARLDMKKEGGGQGVAAGGSQLQLLPSQLAAVAGIVLDVPVAAAHGEW
jgi:hypothetical protein